MTTAAQVKTLVQPLLTRHADLALVGRWLFLKPIHHFARAILIDRTLGPEHFNPRWAVVHLFEWRRFFMLDWGELLYNETSTRPGLWKISDSDIDLALCREIEARALPALRALDSLDKYIDFVSRHYFRHKLFEWPKVRIIVEVALGDLDAARTTMDMQLANWSADHPAYDQEDRDELERIRALCVRLAADDRAGMASLLHEWEAATAKNLKIGHLWQSTPFPLELKT
jgi:hypothetical protein